MTHRLLSALLGASALTVISAGTAFAGGTAAGTNVQNTFTLDYQVEGVDQTQINNAASPTEFTVDRLVDLTVANEGGASVPVAPGAQDQRLVFSLTNDGNDTQAYALSVIDVAGDTFNPDNVTLFYYVDDGDGVYEPGADDGAPITYNGTSTADLDADDILFVVVEGDIDAGQEDGDTAQIALIADTLDAGTTTETDPDGDTTNTLDGTAENVLADAAGTDDNANEGDHSARGTYTVAAADLTAVKAVSVYRQAPTAGECDTIPGTPPATDQYSVPLACVEYVISVDNNGSTAATSIVLNDDLSGKQLTFVTATATGFTGGAFDPLITTFEDTDCAVGTCEVNFEGATLAASGSGSIIIRALIN